MALAAACIISACSYQDAEPESSPEAIDLRLEFESSMIHTGAANSIDGIKAGDGNAYDIRHTVEVWAKDSDGLPVEPHTRTVLTNSDIISPDCRDVTLNLANGSYIIYAWTDYVLKGTSSDYFYDTSDLRKITLTGVHKGNNDYMDAFFGQGEITVSHDSDGKPLVSGGDIEMKRAVRNMISMPGTWRNLSERYTETYQPRRNAKSHFSTQDASRPYSTQSQEALSPPGPVWSSAQLYSLTTPE